MKKILLIASTLVLALGLSACKPKDECPEGQTMVDGVCKDDTTPGGQDVYWCEDCEYLTSFSGVANMNPYSETMADASTMYGYLTDALYTGDIDWEKAIADGLATKVGDFSAGVTSLPYARIPSMAAGEPQKMDEAGKVWRITLRDDLEFEDGTKIDANTFEYSWKQLLDPKLLNARGSNLYAETDLPLVNGEVYFKQASLKTDAKDYPVYIVNEVEYTRVNGLYGAVIGHPDWPLYYITAASDYSRIVKGEEHLFLEDWKDAKYGVDGFVLETEAGDAFKVDADGNLIAPEAGWMLDGVEIPTTGEAVGYAGALPAYMDSEGNEVAEYDEDGLPKDGVQPANDPVAWSEVGFKVIDNLTIELTLTSGKTAWDLKYRLMSGITGVVHPGKYEEGMNDVRTMTNYGTVDNPLVSYGPYTLDKWNDGQNFKFIRRDDYMYASNYRIKRITYQVIVDQADAILEYKEGRLDVVGVSGDDYKTFSDSPYKKLSPSTTFFRFAFNIEGSDAYALNPILVNPDFRRAFYFAIDRLEFATTVNDPSHPTQQFLGPLYLSTEYNSVSYRESVAGKAVSADLYPDTYGFNPEEAKRLFDKAYDAAISAGDIAEGDLVSVEYKFYDVDRNHDVANWVKSTVEAIFNKDEAAPIFELKLAPVSDAALDQAWDNGDFEMTFGGWTGLDKNAPSMLGQVYNTAFTYMLEKGFDTKDMEVTVNLANTKAALVKWIAEVDAKGDAATDDDTAAKLEWEAVLDKFEGDVLTCTYNELFEYAYGEFYNVNDVNYEGKVDDFDNITAALETVLLDQMIAIPLFTRVSAVVYSSRVGFDFDAYHAWLGWGGIQYMYIKK
jgi:oligopeptide transport system substrate-binding protein